MKITEIISEDSTLMDHGFDHLKDLDSLRKLYISNNGFITNLTIKKLSYVKNTLEQLHVIDCPNINDNGISLISDLR